MRRDAFRFCRMFGQTRAPDCGGWARVCPLVAGTGLSTGSCVQCFHERERTPRFHRTSEVGFIVPIQFSELRPPGCRKKITTPTAEVEWNTRGGASTPCVLSPGSMMSWQSMMSCSFMNHSRSSHGGFVRWRSRMFSSRPYFLTQIKIFRFLSHYNF